jgi:hypothetical protein
VLFYGRYTFEITPPLCPRTVQSHCQTAMVADVVSKHAEVVDVLEVGDYVVQAHVVLHT